MGYVGIAFHDARMLWEASGRGQTFRCTLTIGHLSLYLHPSEVRYFQDAFFARKGALPNALSAYQLNDYSDAFLREALGAESLDIMDISAYEGATILHDLNRPVPQGLWNR
jgi:hypothetical protein